MLADIPVFAPITQVVQHFKGDKRGIALFKGRLVTALRFPDLVFPKGKREDAFSVTRTFKKKGGETFIPVLTGMNAPPHFYYHKKYTAEAQATVIKNWDDKRHIDLFWEKNEELINNDPKTVLSKPIEFKYGEDVDDWNTSSGKKTFYFNMAKFYLLDIEKNGLPENNIAIVLGADYGYFCLDIDIKPVKCVITGYSDNPKDNITIFEHLLNTYGYTLKQELPADGSPPVKIPYPFFHEKTKSGGLHLYFKYNGYMDGFIESGTKGFGLKNGKKTHVLHWDILSDHSTTKDDLIENGEIIQQRYPAFAKSYGQDGDKFYEFIVPPFDNEGNCNAFNLRHIITEVDKAHPEVRYQIGVNVDAFRIKKDETSFWDDSDIVKNDLTYFLDALILNRCVVKQPHAKSYYFRTEYTTETALKKCIQEKKSQREFRIDGIITSMEMYEEYVTPILDVVSFKMLSGSLWRLLAGFIKRVVDNKAEFFKDCVQDYVRRCRAYESPDDKEVEALFSYKLKHDDSKVSNHRYLAATIRNQYGVRPPVFDMWEKLVPVDFHLDFIKDDENIWCLNKFFPPIVPDLETEIWNFEKNIPYMIDLNDGLTYSSMKDCATWRLEDAVKWVKHTLVYMTNGGDPYYITKNIAENEAKVIDVKLERRSPKKMQTVLSDCKIRVRAESEGKGKVTLWDVVEAFRVYITYDRETFSFVHTNNRYVKGRDSLFNTSKQCVGATIPYHDVLNKDQQDKAIEGIKEIISTLVGCPKKYDDPRFILAMDWLSDMLCNPMKKPGIMPYLYSHEHGAGKSKFFEFLSDFVIGDYYSTTMFLSNFEKFNSIIEKKLFIFISEANRSDQIKYETQIKSAITDGKTTIERKGYDSFMAVVSARIAMAANVESLIDAENRRNMLWEPVFNKSEEYITMYKEVFESDRSKYYGAVFYTYLTEQHAITTKDFRFALQAIPINQTVESMIYGSLHPILKSVVEQIREGDKESLFIDPTCTDELAIVGKLLVDKIHTDTGTKYTPELIEKQFRKVFRKDGEMYYDYKKCLRNGSRVCHFVFNNWKESAEVLFSNLKLTNMYNKLMKSEMSELANELIAEEYSGKSEDELRKECEELIYAEVKRKLMSMSRSDVISKIEAIKCSHVGPEDEL